MAEPDEGPTLTAEHFHSHLRRRMEQRGITEEEVRETVRRGWDSGYAKPGTHGRTLVFTHDARWKKNLLRRERSDRILQSRR